MNANNNSMNENVLKWALKEGFTFEMVVAQKFREAGFDVSQFSYFTDPNTKKAREIDVLAEYKNTYSNNNHQIEISVRFIIECKYAQKAWVIFSAKRKPHPFIMFSQHLNNNFELNKSGRDFNGRIVAKILQKVQSNINNHEILKPPNIPGYILKQSPFQPNKQNSNSEKKPETNQELPYKASMGVLSAVEADIILNNHIYANLKENPENNHQDSISLYYNISFPVISIRGKLFKVWLNEKSNKVECAETDHELLISTHFLPIGNIGKNINSSIWIITEEYLDIFVHKAMDMSKLLINNDSNLQNIFEAEINKLEDSRMPF